MLKTVQVMPKIAPRGQPAKDLRPFASVIMSPEAIQAARLARCNDHCPDNFGGKCRACCGGGTPLEVIVKLNVSKCALGRWKQ